MSNFQFVGGSAALLPKKLATTAATTIVPAGEAYAVVSLTLVNTTTSVATSVTVAITDGTTTWYLRNAVVMAAKEKVEFTLGYPLDENMSLQVTASVANEIDVFAVVVLKSRQ